MPALFTRKKPLVVVLALLLVVAVLAAYLVWQNRKDTSNSNEHQELQPVEATGATQPEYDAIVAGTDPEGVMAAVSAARNGLKVLLVDGRDRDILGGLFTLGGLNSLDLNKSPNRPAGGKLTFLNKGLFQEWYDQIEGTSFDVNTAANVFNKMVSAEPNIDLMMKVREMKPELSGETVTGLRVVKEDGTAVSIGTKVLIDATQDADMAVAAGVPYTYGREDIGEPEKRMAVTLVFKMSGVTQAIWDSFGKHPNSGNDSMSAWGFPTAKEYVSSNPERVKLRGLNIGRQNDGTILINAMHIYDVDALDPKSVREAIEIGRKEAPLIADYLKKTFKEFRDLSFAGTASELYVRETRHTIGEYRLRIADLMENRDFWDAVAYGSYEVDIQSTGPGQYESGAVLMNPQAYGVPFRSFVPMKIDGLLVVGRSASFDTLPHGSARVVPLGMAAGEAAGAAAKLAIDKGISFRELSRSKGLIAELRNRLTAQGMDLNMPEIKTPDYAKHRAYPGLLAAVSMYLTIGDYDNKAFNLDGPSNAQRYANNWVMVKKVHPDKFIGVPQEAIASLGDPGKQPLTLDQAAYTIALTAGLDVKPQTAVKALKDKGWLSEETVSAIADAGKLTNGDSYMLVRDMMEKYVGVEYE